MNEALITVYTQAARYMIQELLSILAVIKATYEDHHLSNGSLIVDMKLSVGYLSHSKDATFDAYQMRCDVFCCAKGKNKPIQHHAVVNHRTSFRQIRQRRSLCLYHAG